MYLKDTMFTYNIWSLKEQQTYFTKILLHKLSFMFVEYFTTTEKDAKTV